MSGQDPTHLPADLPVPVDDGAADHLAGAPLPSLTLPATGGGAVDLADAAAGTLVLYVYPRTGRPGEDPPPGWDEIPGARGCTPQACAFRDHHPDLAAAGARVHGLSAQPLDEQEEAAERLRLPYPLLSDPDLRLAAAMDLPTFDAEVCGAPARLYRRLTIVARGGRVADVIYPVFPPGADAARALDLLRG